MKLAYFAPAAIALAFTMNLSAQDAKTALTTPQQKAGYAIGLNMGKSFKAQGVDADPDAIARGVKDALSGAVPALNEAEAQKAMTDLQASVEARMKEIPAKNKKEGEEFLAANKSKEGVKTTASGLQYKVIKQGAGAKPKSTDTVSTHYRGTLINGTEFDSSYKRNEPAEFPVDGVIKGWTEALQLMNVGSKWQLFIPSDLAYGERGAGPQITGNSTLIFDIELLEIKGAK